MSRFAEGTSVPVARSRAEIEELLTRYGATSFASGHQPGTAIIVFVAHKRHVQFVLPLPVPESFAFVERRGRKVRRTPIQQQGALDQELRRRWRALALVIKAKLEAVATGITTFEAEFLAHIVLPDGQQVGQWIRPQLEQAYSTGKMPPLLGAGGPL